MRTCCGLTVRLTWGVGLNACVYKGGWLPMTVRNCLLLMLTDRITCNAPNKRIGVFFFLNARP